MFLVHVFNLSPHFTNYSVKNSIFKRTSLDCVLKNKKFTKQGNNSKLKTMLCEMCVSRICTVQNKFIVM